MSREKIARENMIAEILPGKNAPKTIGIDVKIEFIKQ